MMLRHEVLATALEAFARGADDNPEMRQLLREAATELRRLHSLVLGPDDEPEAQRDMHGDEE